MHTHTHTHNIYTFKHIHMYMHTHTHTHTQREADAANTKHATWKTASEHKSAGVGLNSMVSKRDLLYQQKRSTESEWGSKPWLRSTPPPTIALDSHERPRLVRNQKK